MERIARYSPPRKVTYFEPGPPRLARNTIIESTFEVGRTMRVDCGQLDPGAENGARVCPSVLTKTSLRTGALAVMQSISSPHWTIGSRIAVADA